MNRILTDIIKRKRSDLSGIIMQIPDGVDELKKCDFASALKSAPAPAIIAEIKQASPSKGQLVDQFEPATIAREYLDGGAVALSVLTDEPFFKGSAEFLVKAKRATGLPTLCKDFFIDPLQVAWARRIGADAILLIVRILSRDQIKELMHAAAEEDLAVLVETHNEAELEIAEESGVELIGVNNRDLDAFITDLATAERLAPFIPEHATAIAESGIKLHTDIQRLQRSKYNCFLIGESLMQSENRSDMLRELRGVATKRVER